MSRLRGETARPPNARLVSSTLLVIAIVLVVWKFVDYRSRLPPPPHKIGEVIESR